MATIFIVDDDQAIGEMLSLVLENEGFQTVTCLDGLRAVEMFPIVKPDLILLDVMLPGLDGTEVARRIRATSNVRPFAVWCGWVCQVVTVLRSSLPQVR